MLLILLLAVPNIRLEKNINKIESKVEQNRQNLNHCDDQSILLDDISRAKGSILTMRIEKIIHGILPFDYDPTPEYSHSILISCNDDTYYTINVRESMLSLSSSSYGTPQIRTEKHTLSRKDQFEQLFEDPNVIVTERETNKRIFIIIPEDDPEKFDTKYKEIVMKIALDDIKENIIRYYKEYSVSIETLLIKEEATDRNRQLMVFLEKMDNIGNRDLNEKMLEKQRKNLTEEITHVCSFKVYNSDYEKSINNPNPCTEKKLVY
ncbi:hypothetical protein IJG22_00860 [Candidatus Saccharibacteria bacterium]|nr:hypothetical protein [Candidatus Saccharibacteria bacterium]